MTVRDYAAERRDGSPIRPFSIRATADGRVIVSRKFLADNQLSESAGYEALRGLPGIERARTLEAYAKHYTMAWPFEEHDSGRPSRPTPLA